MQAEGIFRITAGNSQEEYVRDQLNKGVIPEGIDVHCLAGLIKVHCGFLLIVFHSMRSCSIQAYKVVTYHFNIPT